MNITAQTIYRVQMYYSFGQNMDQSNFEKVAQQAGKLSNRFRVRAIQSDSYFSSDPFSYEVIIEGDEKNAVEACARQLIGYIKRYKVYAIHTS